MSDKANETNFYMHSAHSAMFFCLGPILACCCQLFNMPKDRRERSVSLDRSRLSPYPCSPSCSRRSLLNTPLEDDTDVKQWEEARCPVCMEHPHNAILLMCSSHDKGCRPFMCDTSYRHSNCFDQFRKSFGDGSAVPAVPETVVSDLVTDLEVGDNLEESTPVISEPSEKPAKPKLVCPLCRGQINGWTVVDTARDFMNAKSRSCACETCDFSGTYKDLRKHARLVHPLARPTEADPERESNWRRMERQRDLGDLLSTLQSSFGDERTGESTLTVDEGGWMTVFFLVRFIRPGNTPGRSSTSRARSQVAVGRSLRRLWGETYEGEVAESRDDEENEGGDSVEPLVQRRYVRRRYRDRDREDHSTS